MITKEIPNSTFSIKADLVLLAMGFVGPTSSNALNSLKLKKDSRTNIHASYRHSKQVKIRFLLRVIVEGVNPLLFGLLMRVDVALNKLIVI